ncbi:uncharacterized protein LOC124666456 [Lolium rigidum]|uniref:uncharacterized protein LOC124666456 n=1 Tax=Lolium rigidum TaxID=89674 RepID=UPI001F5C63BD|nr:uncharacterized protein LOC124666456 [Lolium rigidum]
MGFSINGSEDVKGLAASLGELQVEASPSSPSREKEIDWLGNGDDAATDDDVWDDSAILDRDWAHRKNQFVKMGYRDGITEGQKDAAQEGFNIGFGQSVHVGYKWGLVRGITSALDSLPDSLKEKLLLDGRRKGKLEDLHKSVQGISSEGALRLFHESILQDNPPPEENRLQTVPNDLLLLLNECPDVQVPEELTRVP